MKFLSRWRHRHRGLAIAIRLDELTLCARCKQTIVVGDAVAYSHYGLDLIERMQGRVNVVHGCVDICLSRALEKIGEKEAAAALADSITSKMSGHGTSDA
jgi:hypothetical protein